MFVGTVEVTLLVLLAAILAGPILGVKLRIPGLLSLIFLGMALGPFGLGWLGRIDLVTDLGAIGILYLMFLAGLGFNLNAFAENRASAIGFGLLSFIIPFSLSVASVLTFFEAQVLAAALIGAMWASNTLVAYPDVRAAGLDGTRAVRDAVSGGVVADVLSLLVLAVATAHVVIESVDPTSPGADPARAASLPLVLTIPVLALFALWLLPKVGEWFFVRVGRSRVQRLIFALAAMAATASVAVAAGLEGIIGAFLAGIGLNRLVPNNGELMERIDFVGSSLFIPAFLVSIGLRIDPAALFDIPTLTMGLAFTGLVVVGKATAVAVASRFFRYSFDEAGLMTALSIGQAASTLAIAQVGLGLGLFGQRVVNASVLAIVATAFLTSFGTQFFIRRVPAPATETTPPGERILVDARPVGGVVALFVEFAGRVARGDGGIQVPFAVSTREEKAVGRSLLAEAEALAIAAGHDTEGIARISESFVDGVLELADEVDATLLLLGWPGPRLGTDHIFGSELDTIGARSTIPTVAAHLAVPWVRVVLVLGNRDARWHAPDARLASTLATRLKAKDGTLAVIAGERSLADEHLGANSDFEFRAADLPGDALLEMLRPDDLVVAPAYLLQEMPLPRRLRLSARLADTNLAVVGGAGRLSVAPSSMPHAMERILGPKG